jgi:hypothetical protein
VPNSGFRGDRRGHHQRSRIPRLKAIITAWVRLEASSVGIMFFICALTVPSEMSSSAAISVRRTVQKPAASRLGRQLEEVIATLTKVDAHCLRK